MTMTHQHATRGSQVLFALCLVFPAALAGAGLEGETKPYVGFGLAAHCGGLGTVPDGVTGACFALPQGARRAEVILRDDAFGDNVAGMYTLMGSGEPSIPFCGRTGLELPAGATHLDISILDPVLATLRCFPDVPLAATGNITVAYG